MKPIQITVFDFFICFVCGRPIVFVIKDFDTFEANLVMSTLSPEDIEFEQSRSAAQANLQNSTTDNIVLDKTNVDGDAANDAEKEPAAHDEDEPNDGIVNAKKRNHMLASFADTFESNSSRCASLDVVVRTKKRRTSKEHRRDTHLPSANGTETTDKSAPPQLPYMNLDSENVEVVFQDDSPDLISDAPQLNGLESMDVDMQSNNNDLLSNANGSVRLPLRNWRQQFPLCYTQNDVPSESEIIGKILVAPDEE